MKNFSLIVLLGSIVIYSCKKEKTITPPDPKPVYTKSDTLQQGLWKLNKATAGGGLLDLMPALKNCQKDNLYTFNADKTIGIDEGAEKCSPGAAQTYKDGTWALLNNDKEISIGGGTITAGLGNITGKLVILSMTTLQVQKDTTISGIPTTIDITFTNVH